MEWLVNNWYIIVAIIAVIIMAAAAIYRFVKLPTETQIEAIKEWLKLAVTEAEKIYQSQTGALKLRYCYELLAEKFPAVARFISFSTFSDWVDEALVWLNNQLASNSAVAKIVYGETKSTEE